MAVERIITKQLIGLEDLLIGKGQASQTRGGTVYTISKINPQMVIDSTAELKAIVSTLVTCVLLPGVGTYVKTAGVGITENSPYVILPTGGDGTVGWYLKDTTAANVTAIKTKLPQTTELNEAAYMMDGLRFAHCFKHSTGDTIAPDGFNTFVGREAGNFTMGSTATDVAHGSYNTAIGYRALLFNTTGQSNCGVGYRALQDNTTGDYNIGMGRRANHQNITGSANVAVGHGALFTHTSASNNVAIGYHTLYLNTADSNVAVGHNVLQANTTGNNLVAVGYAAGFSNTTGSYNVSFGNSAGYSNLTGASNTAIGHKALYANTASSNTAVGYNALVDNTLGTHGVAIGHSALFNNTTGNRNISIGNSSLYTNITGSYNIAIGYQALNASDAAGNVAIGEQAAKLATGNYNTSVGYQSLVANTTGLNNTAIGKSALAACTTGQNNFGIGLNAGNDAMVSITTQDNTGALGNDSITAIYSKVALTVTSDIRDKTDIDNVKLGLDFVNQLNPISYRFRKNRNTIEAIGRKHLGFSAQEIAVLQGDAEVIDTSNPDSLKYNSDDMIPILVNAIKELNDKLNALRV